MSEELHSQVAEHGKDIAKLAANALSMEKSIKSLAESVKTSANTADTNFARIHEKLDGRNNSEVMESKTTLRWILGAVTSAMMVVMAATTLMLTLTVDPMRQRIMEQDDDSDKHSEEFHDMAVVQSAAIARGSADHEANVHELASIKGNIKQIAGQDTVYISKLREESRIQGQAIAELKKAIEWHEKWINDVDGAGSRRWLKGANTPTP